MEGSGYYINPEANEGRLFVTFDDEDPNSGVESNYGILSTDYDNYVIVYSCNDYTFFSYEYLWILSRKPEIDEMPLKMAEAMIEN